MSPYTEWAIDKKANRNFQVLRMLEKDPRVDRILTVDFLPHTFRRAARQQLDLRKLTHVGFNRHWGVCASWRQISKKLFSYSSALSIFSERLLYADLRRLLIKLEMNSRLVVWSYTPLFTGYLDHIPAKMRVFDTVDNWMEHPAYLHLRDRLAANYRRISTGAEYIFTVTPYLVEKLYSGSRHAEWVPNGVDVDLYSRKYPEPKDIEKIPHPRAGYVGVMQNRIDYHLLRYLVSRQPDTHFIFAGPVWPDADLKGIEGKHNVHLLGPKAFDSLPGYLQHMDVGIIPHSQGELVKSMNPMKLYEYLAAGIPVVMTPVPGAEPFKDVVHVTADYQEFSDMMCSAIRDNRPDLRQRRLNAVRPHSWSSRVETMLGRIFSIPTSAEQ